MNIYRILLMLFMITNTLICAAAPKYQYTIEISSQNIEPYTKTMNDFLQTKRKQLNFINSSVGSFFASIYGSFSGINMDEARAFLNRAFADEKALNKAIAALPQDTASITYLQELISKLSPNAINRKKSDSLALLMKKNQHPLIPVGVKPWDTNKVSDDTFYRIAACNFMAYHIVESEGPARKKIEITPVASHGTKKKPKPLRSMKAHTPKKSRS